MVLHSQEIVELCSEGGMVVLKFSIVNSLVDMINTEDQEQEGLAQMTALTG